MSDPDDVQQQPGALPPQASRVPPAASGSQPDQQVPEGYDTPLPGNQVPPPGYGTPPPGNQVPPPGYGTPPPGNQPPGQQPYPAANQPAPAGGMRFEMPRPRNFNDVLPQAGFSGMFTVTGMPTGLKVSYWIWLIGGLLGLLGGVIGLFGSVVMLAILPALGFVVLLLVLAALTLAVAQIILAMKMKEGREWARFALTLVAGISLVLAVISASIADGRGGGSWPGFLASLAAVVLMWTPSSQAWFAGSRGRTP